MFYIMASGATMRFSYRFTIDNLLEAKFDLLTEGAIEDITDTPRIINRNVHWHSRVNG